MKKTLLALTALLAAAGLHAEESSSYSVTTDVTLVSKYVFRGVQQQKASLQPSVEFSGGGFTAGIWAAQALSDRTAAWAKGTEIDLYAGYEFALPNDFAFSLGLTSYQYPKNRPSFGELGSTLEGSAGLSGPLGPLSGSVTYFHDWDLDSDTFEFGLSYGTEVADKTTVEVAGTYGIAKYKAGGDYDYYAASVTFSYQATEKWALALGLHWSDTDLTGLKSSTWVSVGVSAGF